MFNARSIVVLIQTIFWSVVGLLGAILDPKGRLFLRIGRLWARQLLWLSGVKVTVLDGTNVDWHRNYLVFANHQSALDIPLLMGYLPLFVRFMAKKSLFRIPLFGWALALGGYIPVDRKNQARARRSISRGAEKLKRGPSLMVFPEGTRTSDGRIQAFKSGAFLMALKAEVPLLPVAIRGMYKVVPKTTIAIRPGRVELIMGSPISTEGVGMKNKEALVKRAREAVVAMFESGQPH